MSLKILKFFTVPKQLKVTGERLFVAKKIVDGEFLEYCFFSWNFQVSSVVSPKTVQLSFQTHVVNISAVQTREILKFLF